MKEETIKEMLGSEMAIVNAIGESEYPCRVPTELELMQVRLMNVPMRGFCVSADIERITAESYQYLRDSDKFASPVI